MYTWPLSVNSQEMWGTISSNWVLVFVLWFQLKFLKCMLVIPLRIYVWIYICQSSNSISYEIATIYSTDKIMSVLFFNSNFVYFIKKKMKFSKSSINPLHILNYINVIIEHNRIIKPFNLGCLQTGSHCLIFSKLELILHTILTPDSPRSSRLCLPGTEITCVSYLALFDISPSVL